MSNHWLPNGVNEVICSELSAGLSPSGNGKRTDLGPPALGAPRRYQVSPALHYPHSILRTPFAGSIADPARMTVLAARVKPTRPSTEFENLY
ncbi:hypothetical protein EVAR_76576_1 [Eumeta japonica]|uniref:Uncharacterized protein n=1 Tax=Eumeta variegata TaxID=151549 RepID=A0A4C1T8F9_EUMVA|nr:hypothetical protein EVAR_76576_1 [Eumeta japonica]